MLAVAKDVLATAFAILAGASVWLVMSFVLAGLVHSFADPVGLQRVLGNRRISTLFKAAFSGMMLPLCSCGIIPIGLSLYYSGAYLGPTLAFMTAAPIINPAALILAYALLGPKIATIYALGGFLVSIAVGVAGNRFGGPELKMDVPESAVEARAAVRREPFPRRVLAGQRWGFLELGAMMSRYALVGMLLAGGIIALVPDAFIQSYLGNPGVLSIGAAAALGGVMHVCAVGHIPLTAALVAAGAAPGLAITFLMAGVGTNIPELVSIWKLMGRRSVLIYVGCMVTGAFAVGLFANAVLGSGFTPVFDTSGATLALRVASGLALEGIPEFAQYVCAAVIIGLAAYSWASNAPAALARLRRAEA
ncbi:MAG: efflux transporter SaoE [Actinomycetota bacterium]|nr:MAG: hypothetical protein FD171_2006 [Actinomycetota bacterium]MDO8949998.1 efflux transporter SaoE [Actinomycetota bacterium]MDP3630209.1 efflux transporter SaoE [Actinomycetota bacterium]